LHHQFHQDFWSLTGRIRSMERARSGMMPSITSHLETHPVLSARKRSGPRATRSSLSNANHYGYCQFRSVLPLPPCFFPLLLRPVIKPIRQLLRSAQGRAARYRTSVPRSSGISYRHMKRQAVPRMRVPRLTIDVSYSHRVLSSSLALMAVGLVE
jgi:hypothetical protein